MANIGLENITLMKAKKKYLTQKRKFTLECRQKKHNEKTKEKISKRAKERFKDKTNNPMYGKLGENNPNSKKIYCKELDKTFVGIRNASKTMNIPSSNITRSLKSNGYYSAGKQDGIILHWVYVEE